MYAVEVGVGQLRADPRVVNLEGHNLASIDRSVIAEAVGLITIDLSYLSIARALPQLAGLTLAPRADLVVLVKPTFESRTAKLANEDEDLVRAHERVVRDSCSTRLPPALPTNSHTIRTARGPP